MTERRFGRYVLGDCIGTGASAQVWSAHALRANGSRAPVAIKILHGLPLPEARARLERELDVVSALAHPNIVGVIELVHDGGRLGLVMELCRGSLADWLRRHGPLPAFAVARVGAETLAGLARAHRAGVLHRDVKPANLLVGDDGSVKLGDFGIAKLRDEASATTHTSAVWGTMPFVAPERRYGRVVDARADLYGVAATLACLAIGEVAGELFVPEVRERLAARLPTALLDVLARAGSYAPDERFPDAESMLRALESARADLDARDDVRLHELSPLPTLDTHLPSDHYPRGATRPRITWLLGLGTGALGLALGAGAALRISPPVAAGFAELPMCSTGAQDVRIVTRVGPRETMDVTADDLDRDGKLDVLFVNQLDETLSIYWGGGRDVLVDPLELPIGRSGVRPAVGDVDGDGLVDIMIAQTDAASLLLLRGRSQRSFAPTETFFQGPAPGRIALLDWDDDGMLDLLLQTATSDRCTAWRRGLGDGTFAPYTCIGAPSDLLDPYGTHPPAVYRRTDDSLLVRHRPGTNGELGPSEPIADLRSLGAPRTWLVSIRDVDVDGFDEVYAVASARDRPTLLRLDDAPCEVWSALVIDPSVFADVADVDGDGLLDVLGRASCSECASNHVLALGVAR